jgi:hypothetical protein
MVGAGAGSFVEDHAVTKRSSVMLNFVAALLVVVQLPAGAAPPALRSITFPIGCTPLRGGTGEATNHYFFAPLDLVEKVLNCRDLLDRWLPAEQVRSKALP